MEIVVLLVIAGVVYWLFKDRKTAPGQQQHNWVRKFSVYYATNALCLHGSSLGDVPERLVGLMERQIARDIQQTFLASLANYLRDHDGRDMQPGDYQLALADIRNLLSAQTRRANSYMAMVPLIRATHKEETGMDITEAELTALCGEIIDRVKTDEEAAVVMMGQVLRFNMEEMFRTMFGVRYDDYLKTNYPRGQPAPKPATNQT